MSKLALNILSFYDREPTVVEIISSDQKCTKSVCYFYGKVKEEKTTAT